MSFEIGKEDNIRNKTEKHNNNKDLYLDNSNIEENKAYINNLNFLKNKEFIKKNYDPRFKIGLAERLLIEELEKDGVFYSIDEYGYSIRIFLPKGGVHLTQGINYGLNNTSTVKTFEDKLRTNHILYEDGFLIPKQTTLIKENSSFLTEKNNFQNIKSFIKKVGYPIIIKPHKGKRGEGIYIIHNETDLCNFYEEYNKGIYKDEIAIAQEFIRGDEIRIIYFNEKIEIAYKKRPLSIEGDGIHSIKEFLDAKKIKGKILEETTNKIEGKGYNTNKILNHGEKIEVFEYVNEASDFSEEIQYTEDDKNFIKKIAKSFGSNYFGIDIITQGEVNLH